MEDKIGNIWIGTRNTGLYRYDGKKHLFFGIKIDDTNTIQTKNDSISIIKVLCQSLMQMTKMMINTTLLFSILTTLFSCNGLNQKPIVGKTEQNGMINHADSIPNLGKNIDDIFQDKNDHYWFASNGEGVYRYDGKTMAHFTESDGLCSNFVWKIQEDINGLLWFVTRDGVCSFDGILFSDQTEKINSAPYGKLNDTDGGLFFSHLNGICFYDGKTFTNFTIHPPTYQPPTNTTYRPFAVYCTLVDQSGKIWFGTQEKGVCFYNGNQFSWIHGKNLDGPAVRCIFQDTKGGIWFGNNGGGLFHYDGTTLRNITEENNLHNFEFLTKRMPVDKPDSLARVFAINEDQEGNLWIGTVDAGVWKYDGTRLTNYTTKDGLSSNSVYFIYKDKKGKLWFVSNGEALYHFDGQKFIKATF